MIDFNKVTLLELELLHQYKGYAVEINDGKITAINFEEVATDET